MSWGAGCQVSLFNIFGSLGWVWGCRDKYTHHCSWQDRQTTVQQCGLPQGSLVSYKQAFVWKGVLSGIFLFEAPRSPPQSYIHGSTCSHQVICSPRGGSRSQLQSTFYHGPYPSHHPSALGEFPRCLVTSAQLLQVVPFSGPQVGQPLLGVSAGESLQ